jgi:hypothetical protein
VTPKSGFRSLSRRQLFGPHCCAPFWAPRESGAGTLALLRCKACSQQCSNWSNPISVALDERRQSSRSFSVNLVSCRRVAGACCDARERGECAATQLKLSSPQFRAQSKEAPHASLQSSELPGTLRPPLTSTATDPSFPAKNSTKKQS